MVNDNFLSAIVLSSQSIVANSVIMFPEIQTLLFVAIFFFFPALVTVVAVLKLAM